MLPGHADHMADRTLSYTAATRATVQLIPCGDRSLLERARNRDSGLAVRKSNLADRLHEEVVKNHNKA